jgi:hypothetical protein
MMVQIILPDDYILLMFFSTLSSNFEFCCSDIVLLIQLSNYL